MIHKIQPILLSKAFRWVKVKKITPVLLSAVIATSAGTISTTARATDDELASVNKVEKAYFMFYDGHNIGAVEAKEDVEVILENIRKEFEEEYQMDTILVYDIDFEDIYIGKQFLSGLDDVEKILRANVEPMVKSSIIEINGKDVCTLRSEEVAQGILDSILAPYRAKAEESGVKLEDIGFEEEVVVKDLYVEYENLDDPDSMLQELTQGEVEKQIYTIVEGDNVWVIAEKHDMTVRELLEANAPMEESDILQIGQELNLNLPELPLNVFTVEEEKYTKSIPFETEKKETDSLYINQTKVSQEGKEGESEIIDKVYRRNGIERDRERISETVTKEPVNKIVLVGTKKPVKNTTTSRGGGSSSVENTSGSGTLSWPTSGSLSSRFGNRGGRLHAGIDIANPKGTPIYAADSGTVSYSGYNNGGYGNLIKINHGGGMTTCYAHLSSRSVSQGSSVTKGQLIGYMGNTGNSRGSHLHFEVRINGTPKNPLSYLN